MRRRTLTCAPPLLQVPQRCFLRGGPQAANPGTTSDAAPVASSGMMCGVVSLASRGLQLCPPNCLSVGIVAVFTVTAPVQRISPRSSYCPWCFFGRCAAAIVTGVPINRHFFRCSQDGKPKRHKARPPDRCLRHCTPLYWDRFARSVLCRTGRTREARLQQ